MGKNVFIINGHQACDYAPGKLNQSLVDVAKNSLEKQGHNIKVSHVDNDTDPAGEVEKFIWADVIIFQTPVYWMSVPWKFKKYIDEVYMTGYGTLFADDGRSDDDPSKKYGNGGLLQGTKYMLSTTWNAPLEAFTDTKQFFDGKSVDEVFVAFHKGQSFLGLEKLPTFSCHDVIKSQNITEEFDRLQQHLDANMPA
ncbi:MAG: NAD(P)H-dependent oxidoreductase [Magnetococcales bacterium]|nr:NAD(P)H-dependent oxidoreductase [Magnetococcales bacterium]